MRKISPESLKERDALIQKIGKAKDDLEGEIAEYNRKASELYEELVTPALTQLNEDIDQLKEWATAIVDEAENYAEDRSDKWKEGEAGEAYQAWIDEIRDVEQSIDEVSVEEPEEIDSSVELDVSAFESLSESPEG